MPCPHVLAGEKPIGYGCNDQNSTVYCHLCSWSKPCPRGIEQVEFELKSHLANEHRKPCLFRVDSNGKQTDIP